jgi:hypothetical protein
LKIGINTSINGMYLTKDSLVLALVSEVTSEALAKTRRVVADTATRAVASLLVTVAEKHIWTGWALLKGAIRSTESKIAHTAHVFHCIPWFIVGLVGLNSKLFLGVADTSSGAVIWAYGTFASNTIVVLETFTFSCLAVAKTFV